MKFRLPLFWIKALLLLPALQLSHAATVSNWEQIATKWKTETEFILSNNIGVDYSSTSANIYGAQTLSAGKNVSIDGTASRYALTGDITIRETSIKRAFIASGGSLTLTNLKFNNLYESNSGDVRPIPDPSLPVPFSQSGDTGDALLYACGSVVVSTSEDSAITIINSEFNKNVIIQERSYKASVSADNPDPQHEAVLVSGGALGGQGQFTILFSKFDSNQTIARLEKEGPLACSSGGAIRAQHLKIGNSDFSGNLAKAVETVPTQIADTQIIAKGGAISIENGDAEIVGTTFTGNYVEAASKSQLITSASGGALFMANNDLSYIDDCTFTGNYVQSTTSANDKLTAAFGGAVYTTSGVIKNSSFFNNYTSSATTSQGGAIYLAPLNGHFSLDIIADIKQSIFRGNKMNVSSVNMGGLPDDGTANALYIDAADLSGANSTLDFRAVYGLGVQLYDPIIVNAHSVDASAIVELSFNRPGGEKDPVYDGAIIFHGDSEIAENRVSTLSSSVAMRQYDGEVHIINRAVLGAAHGNADTPAIGARSYDMDKGLMQITEGGHLMANDMRFGQIGQENGAICTFRNGTGAQITAQTISITNGLTVDFQPFLDSHDSGTTINTDTLSLGGLLQVADKSAGYLEFYLNKRWAENQRYLVFSLSDNALNGKEGDFSSIISAQAGSDLVTEAYGHRGKWRMEWVGNDLFAVWEAEQSIVPPPVDPEEPPVDPGNPGPTPPINPPAPPQINPELAGGLVIDSLWSTVANMKSLSGTAFSQIGLSRFKMGKDVNFWASGLADFSRHNTQGGSDGYIYNGFGYSVGSDILLSGKNMIVGLAFGNLYGTNKSRSYAAEIDQTSYMGMLYSRWIKELDKDTLLSIDGSASFGTVSNKLKTYYSDSFSSHGKWDNTAVRLTLKAAWDHTLNKTWTLTPFIGLEYDDASQGGFTEEGTRIRRFQDSTLRNLALPAGIALSSKTDCFDNMHWYNSLAVSYIPDVYRKNPETSAILFSQDYSWAAKGIKPLRNALRVQYDTRLQLNEAWTIFAGYSLEGRKNSVYHHANAGFNYAF